MIDVCVSYSVSFTENMPAQSAASFFPIVTGIAYFATSARSPVRTTVYVRVVARRVPDASYQPSNVKLESDLGAGASNTAVSPYTASVMSP